MKYIRFVPVLVLLSAAPLTAQTPSARAQELAAEFTKFKNETREKKGVTIRKYKEAVSQPWIASLSEYAGHYQSDDFPYLAITIEPSGRITGEGRDEERFTLRNASISGGIITATKVFERGRTEPFEAVFLKRSDRGGPNEDYTVRFGIGHIVEGSPHGSLLRAFAAKQ